MGMSDRDKKPFDKFDKSVMQVVIFAKASSIDAQVDCIYPESFMIGILTTGENDVTSVLVEMDIDLQRCLGLLKKELLKKRDNNESKDGFNIEDLKISNKIVDVCELADRIRADSFGDEYIGVKHIFLALLRVSPYIKDLFENYGLTVVEFDNRVRRVREMVSSSHSHSNSIGQKIDALEAFCVDVTEQARKNELDPIIAREKEIENAITILCRRGKNNPILLGEPGVGKTAIVEGISQRIVSGTVPKQLRNNKVFSLNLSSLVAGTKYRGEFEERIQALIKEVRNASDCILFIDEIHTLVGAGSAAGGALDASNILKPFLARGDLRCVGATTLADFKKYFQKDGALTRRFQQIMIEEPTKEQMYQILAGIKQRYEEYHRCIISDDAVHSIISLTDRYLPDKNFPDKAIDCMDMACAQYASWDVGLPICTSKNYENKNLVITTDHVASIISDQCQIPLEVIQWDNNERIQKIEDKLSERVIGQPDAIKTVCRVLKNAYSGIRNPQKPIGSFVFGGETGTGKTYMAKELASIVFGRDTSFIRLDMTEFSEKHSVSKLVGSPPGYVGFQETDIFIDKIKRKPYCIVLLDEIEKAHPDVLKLFLQVMSDGIMSDATGNRADFKNVILIMTGNFGLNVPPKKTMGFDELGSKSEGEAADVQKRLITYCKSKYGAEFVNRVDEFVPFVSFVDEDLKRIIQIQLSEIPERIVDRDCKLVFSDKVYNLIVKMSKSSHGKNATMFKRLIAKEIEPCISDALMSLGDGRQTITIDVKDDKFIYVVRKTSTKSIKSKGRKS